MSEIQAVFVFVDLHLNRINQNFEPKLPNRTNQNYPNLTDFIQNFNWNVIETKTFC